MERMVYSDEISAVNCLRNNKILVDHGEKTVIIKRGTGPGIKLWGAIDYLKNRHGYGWYKTGG